MIDKAAHLKNLEWMSNELFKIASNKNLSLTEELKQVRALKQSYLNKKSALEDEAAKGAPGSLFNVETAQAVADRLNSEIKAPYVNAKVSTLGGPENVAVMMTVSTDPKDQWANGILHNSRYGMFSINNDGEVEHHSGSFNRIDEPRMNFRKRNVKNVDQLIQVINNHIDQVNNAHVASKQASLEKASISINVFNKNWTATPVNKEGKMSYDIADSTGKKVLNIKPLNGQEMNAEHLKWAAERELTHGYKQAILKENIAFLKSGSKVLILASDKSKGRLKFADLSVGVRGWAPESKFKVLASENETMKHGDHVDEVLGHRTNEKLVDCPMGSGNVKWVGLNELLPTTQPPATPESLNDLESSVKPGNCWHSGCENEATVSRQFGNDPKTGKWCKQHADEMDKEALKTALPSTIPNQRGYLDNPPVEKESAGCDQCNAAMINGVFCHETGCPNKSRADREVEIGYSNPDVLDSAEDFEGDVEASLNKQARVVHREDGWHVLSEKGKNLGGPYKTKGEAVKRLRQVEYFKHNGSLRPFSKKAEVMTDPYQALTDHITDMRSRMTQVQERLQSNPLPKQAGEGEKDNSNMDLSTVFEDVSMGLDLIETKLKDEPESEELHKGLEELENLLWEVEMKAGITPKLSEEDKAEPEHKEIVEEVEKQAALPTAITPTLSNPAPTSNATTTSPTPDDQKPTCALCGNMTFSDYAAYQNHMAYTHASDTMPTSPSQKLQPTNVKSEQKESATTCSQCGEEHKSDIMKENLPTGITIKDLPLAKINPEDFLGIPKKKADVMTDETITTNDPNAVIPAPVTPASPVIQNVRPTDDDNLEIPTQAPTSPLPAGQHWQWDSTVGKYVAMTDPTNLGKTI